MNALPKEVDLVYLWVDGEDPSWLKKKNLYTGTPIEDDKGESNFRGRYSNNDELRFSLRSAAKHAPWIRHIFIVTDGQRPHWLKTDVPGISVVDHSEILPEEARPCFNSTVIEHYLHKIPGLAEHYLYANDDMFFNADVGPDFFFGEDGFPIVRMKSKVFGRWHPFFKALVGRKPGQYAHTVAQAAKIVYERLGKYYTGVPHHNIDSYKKSDVDDATKGIFAAEIERSKTNRMRNYADLQRSAFSYYALAIGHAHLEYVDRKTSSRILLDRHDFGRYLQKNNPKLFCVNDSQRISEEQRAQICPLLRAYFPEPSPYEKTEEV